MLSHGPRPFGKPLQSYIKTIKKTYLEREVYFNGPFMF